MGIAAVFASNKWLTLTPVNINHAYLFVYYISFFSVVISAFVYGPARTAIYGLKLLALLCVIVPVTSFIAAVIPGTELWAPNSLESVLVEVVSLLFGLIFWLFSNHVARRAMENEPGSIWYLKEPAITSGIVFSTQR